jgi:murein DD-endopeptidase MepM/ murein hydrolase activator NlpD
MIRPVVRSPALVLVGALALLVVVAVPDRVPQSAPERSDEAAATLGATVRAAEGATELSLMSPAVRSPASPAASPAVNSPVRSPWRWPLDGARIVVRPYRAPPTPWAAGHRGVDLEASSEIVRAPADGVVHFVGFVVNRPVLSIEHAGGLLSSYEPVSSTLTAGDTVKAGDEIGQLQRGHCAIVACLHFGLRLSGEYVSPLLMLGGVPRAVLLPTRPR